jgi:Domain of unknown function (DUF4440)
MRTRLTVYFVMAQAFAVALAVAPTPPPLAEKSSTTVVAQLMAQELAYWAALQRGDTTAGGSFLADDYSQIDSDGVLMDREGTIKRLADRVIVGYALHDMRGTLLCPDLFVVTYSIERTSRGLGREVSGTFTSSSLWANRSGIWLRVRYQETLSQSAR